VLLPPIDIANEVDPHPAGFSMPLFNEDVVAHAVPDYFSVLAV
jgi:hypothetical protein